MSPARDIIAAALTPDVTATILRNIGVELNAVHVMAAERLQGRFNPPADGRTAVACCERLAVALEALTEIVKRKLTDA